jgi:hypothetical protein
MYTKLKLLAAATTITSTTITSAVDMNIVYRARRQAEIQGMSGEDSAGASLRATITAIRSRESALMASEDAFSAAVAFEAQQNASDRAAARDIVKAAKLSAPIAAKSAVTRQAATVWARSQVSTHLVLVLVSLTTCNSTVLVVAMLFQWQ